MAFAPEGISPVSRPCYSSIDQGEARMPVDFISSNVWACLTKAAKNSRTAALVAVAYFGKGAAQLLPLRPGSTLVVDASEHAVASGQTHPNDFLALLRKGVEVFSVPGLHAKTFVFGSKVFVGSANASNHSAKFLIEAMLVSNGAEEASAARRFIRSLATASRQLGPTELQTLQRLWKPPQFTPGMKDRKVASRSSASKLRVIRLRPTEWSEVQEVAFQTARARARKERRLKRDWVEDYITWFGSRHPEKGDQVIAIMTEKNGRQFVEPPAKVIEIEPFDGPRGQAFVLLLEGLQRRRRSVDRQAKMLGRGAKAILSKGRVPQSFAEKLDHSWAD
jgi:hypothetical protein